MSNLNAGDLSAIWQIMLKTMQSENLISSTACDLWFKCFRLDYLDPDKAVFAVENEMKRNIILDKYSDLLATQIEQVIGYTPEIQIVTDTSLAPELNRTEGGPYPTEIVEERRAAREKDKARALEEELTASDMQDRLLSLAREHEKEKERTLSGYRLLPRSEPEPLRLPSSDNAAYRPLGRRRC